MSSNKAQKKPHNGNPFIATKIGETIHSDVNGPLTNQFMVSDSF